jgi:hypothetical protein
MDATGKGHTGLASYYTEKARPPACGSARAWRASRDSMPATSSPPTTCRACSAPGTTRWPPSGPRSWTCGSAAMRPGGRPIRTTRPRSGSARPTRSTATKSARSGSKVAKRIAALNEAAGLPGDWPVPAAGRAKIRTEVAAEFFRAEHGREPADARELAATFAKHSDLKTNAVAGYDLTFSTVKSVSVLWAISDPKTAAVIERA